LAQKALLTSDICGLCQSAPTKSKVLHVASSGRAVSAGQLVVLPLQTSGPSQVPVEARQTAPAFPAGWAQLALAPSHTSAVQGLPSSAQAAPAFPAGWEHVVLDPLQTSVVHGLPSSAQAVPAFPAGCVQIPEELHTSVVQGLESGTQAVPAG